jgi:hypothetical protein
MARGQQDEEVYLRRRYTGRPRGWWPLHELARPSFEAGAFISAPLHRPRREIPTEFLGQKCGLEARPRHRGPER